MRKTREGEDPSLPGGDQGASGGSGLTSWNREGTAVGKPGCANTSCHLAGGVEPVLTS